MNETIRDLVKEALAGEEYGRLILFGSRARGDYGPDSDFDLLITMRTAVSLERKIRIFGLVRRHLARHGVDADIIVRSESEVEFLRHRAGSVVASAVEDGVLL
jgi:predicted nucleotidyltransferase